MLADSRGRPRTWMKYTRTLGTSRYGGLAVSGNYAYLAEDRSGLEIIDISDPANPRHVGGFITGIVLVFILGNRTRAAGYSSA